MIIDEKVKVGQVWERKNGNRVRIVEERRFYGQRDMLLEPIEGKGRKSWKWDKAIFGSMKLISE